MNKKHLPPAHPELVEGQGFVVRQAHHELFLKDLKENGETPGIFEKMFRPDVYAS